MNRDNFMPKEKKTVVLKDEDLEKVNGGAGRYDVVDKGEAWSHGEDLYIAKQVCWFSMISYVPCEHYRRENNEWIYAGDLDMLPNTLFSMEYKGYWEF